jgi:hypothetical protein
MQIGAVRVQTVGIDQMRPKRLLCARIPQDPAGSRDVSRYVPATVLVCILVTAMPTFAQQASQHPACSSSRLGSERVGERMMVAAEIFASPFALQSSDCIGALVTLLDRENAVLSESVRRQRSVAADYGEGYSEYYAELISTVSRRGNLRDRRTMRIVASGAFNPDSRLAARLADEGGATLAPIALTLLRSDMVGSRMSGLGLVGRIYEKRDVHRLPAGMAASLKAAIVEATDERPLRALAVELLGRIGVPADIPLLERIANNDPEVQQTSASGTAYPVREAAAAAIETIRRRVPR